MKTLIFEGAGWESAKHNGVGNCRIRTRIKNKYNRIIYLEMGGHETTEFKGFIDHCFDVIDERKNHTKDLSINEGYFNQYTKENILKFVNEKLDCDFDSLEVINDNSVRVHDTKEPLCWC